YALFLVGNNSFSLTDPDEVFYCQTAKEMTAKNEWLTPFIFGQPQFEKPVLTFWLLEIAFKDERKAFLSALLLATCAFFFGMGKTVFTDMIFTVFILCSFTSFMLAF